VGLFVVVAAMTIIDVVRAPSVDPWRLVLAVGVAALAASAVVYHREVLAQAQRQRAETESLNRILHGLLRSGSPDAAVTGIVDELRAATGADHCVVVRRRARSRVLDATLVAASAGVPPTNTVFPASLLEAPAGGDDEPAAVAARIARHARTTFGLEHLRAAPLVTSGGTVGALVLARRTGGRWSTGAVHLLAEAAREVAAAMERAYRIADAEMAATTDPLTGLPNRRFLDLLAMRPLGRREGDVRAVLMVDIDHFKRLNDRHGHAVGDAVLRRVAEAVASAIRAEDFPIRYGGEEFVVVLREADARSAMAVAERLRRNVAAADVGALRVAGPVTVSVGVAVGAAGEELASLIERADRAMYRAKAAGRDRVVLG
jgi:diguanylate cyclase (GGDEF)-like protein